MTTTNRLGIYIHIPFCLRKCKYCDFLSFGYSDNKILEEYTRAVIEEIRIRSQDWHYREVDSIYIGGGTPSLLSQWDIGKIIDALRDCFNVLEDAEITIEANPATISDEKMEKYLAKGINRISIGVQSFENSILELLGRAHNKNDAFYSFQRAQKAGFKNINLDIMFGIPGQTMKMWKDTVRQCIFLRPTHISLYSLQIEEGTEFYKMMYDEGTLEPVMEVTDREMYHTAMSMMNTAGYKHYEISNCSLPGYESRHNMKYWSYEEYMGLGLGASSFLDGSRFKNCDRMIDYIAAIKGNVAPVDAGSVEKYSQKEEMGVYVFTGLRKVAGLDTEEFRKIFKGEFFNVFDEKLLLKYDGFLKYKDGKLFLTEKGMDISNKIMMEFL
ncbi:MAG: radical SAM family heme chaperone HemW [Clostridiales bacterium]|nr:radical SAM family heme chaperone HemW [Clostridiales bacterium]